MTTTSDHDRFVRQQELVPQDRLTAIKATVIGVGAIGRQLAFQLAAIGVPRLQLVDFDIVDLTNVTTQGYLAADIGMPKVLATAAAIQQLDPAIAVEMHPGPLSPRMEIGDVVFCAWIRSTPVQPSGDRQAPRADSGAMAGCLAR